jgi:hypothetical protein
MSILNKILNSHCLYNRRWIYKYRYKMMILVIISRILVVSNIINTLSKKKKITLTLNSSNYQMIQVKKRLKFNSQIIDGHSCNQYKRMI